MDDIIPVLWSQDMRAASAASIWDEIWSHLLMGTGRFCCYQHGAWLCTHGQRGDMSVPLGTQD